MAKEPIGVTPAEISERIREGGLPTGPARQVFGGPGTGQSCRVCGELIRADQIEIEARGGADGGSWELYCHRECYALWEGEQA